MYWMSVQNWNWIHWRTSQKFGLGGTKHKSSKIFKHNIEADGGPTATPMIRWKGRSTFHALQDNWTCNDLDKLNRIYLILKINSSYISHNYVRSKKPNKLGTFVTSESSLLREINDKYNTENYHYNTYRSKSAGPPRSRSGVKDIVSLRHSDIDKMRKAEYVHRTKRGDFLIHPQWPPTFVHHRLNGLSPPLDVPYFPGRRWMNLQYKYTLPYRD